MYDITIDNKEIKSIKDNAELHGLHYVVIRFGARCDHHHYAEYFSTLEKAEAFARSFLSNNHGIVEIIRMETSASGFGQKIVKHFSV